MEQYTIAILGEPASGKTTFVNLLRDCGFEKRYFATVGCEVHPTDWDGKILNLWDFGRGPNNERHMPLMQGAIYMIRKKTDPVPDLGIPTQVVLKRAMDPKKDMSELLKKMSV